MHDFRPQGGSGITADRTHEEKDLSTRAVLLFAVALAVTVAGAFLLLAGLFASYSMAETRKDHPYPPLRGEHLFPPAPVLETRTREDLETLRYAEEIRLSSYGWIDRKRGVVRIPIDHAMDILIRQGFPARTSPKTAD